jgi:hypothetical protein
VLFSRADGLAAVVVVLLVSSGCGSSATTSTAPSGLVRCALTLNVADQTIPAEGGSGTIGVSAARECTWTVSVDGPWISLKSSSNGQGDATIEFSAAANADPVVRRGALVLNQQRAEITQAAAQCDIRLAESAATFTPAGGSGQIQVRASSGMCTWSASSDQSWISIRSNTDGRGNGSVSYDVASTTGPPRAGTITVAGQRFSITQAEGCTYAIAPNSASVRAEGGNGTIAITTDPGCPWTAASNADWLSFSQGIGTGSGPLVFFVQPTGGPARTATGVVAGQVFTVTQAPGCTYQVQPTSHSIGAAGGTANVSVTTAAGCSWSASSDASWITIQGITSGTASGLVNFAVAATTGPARTGSLTIAGQRVSVSQGAGCTFAISPTQETIPPAGGTGRVNVTAADGCAWTASSGASWIAITSGASGSGSGAVAYTVQGTTGPSRSGSLTIAGQTFTVNQGQGCSFTLVPENVTVPPAGGQTSFEVRTSAGCTWTAASQAPWIAVPPGAGGNGNGTVQLSISPTTGPGRSGTVTAGGRTFTVNQGTGCSPTLSASSENVPASGGNGTIAVTAADGCPWTASSNAPSWLSISGSNSGSGNGSVTYAAAANTGAPRSGTLTVAGHTFTVNQASGCTFTANPETVAAPAPGGPVRIEVAAAADCAWTATSSLLWVTITAGASGTGPGAADLAVAANVGPARSGTLMVAGRTITVNQASGCTFAINPTSAAIPAAGGTASVTVTAGAGCAWTAERDPQATWIVVSSGASGVGDGTVQLTIAANGTGAPPRTGTVTIAGLTFTINQE